MWANLEITSGIIRVFEDAAKWGEPFVGAFAIIGVGDCAIIKALHTNQMSKASYVAAMKELKSRGFHRIKYAHNDKIIERDI